MLVRLWLDCYCVDGLLMWLQLVVMQNFWLFLILSERLLCSDQLCLLLSEFLLLKLCMVQWLLMVKWFCGESGVWFYCVCYVVVQCRCCLFSWNGMLNCVLVVISFICEVFFSGNVGFYNCVIFFGECSVWKVFVLCWQVILVLSVVVLMNCLWVRFSFQLVVWWCCILILVLLMQFFDLCCQLCVQVLNLILVLCSSSWFICVLVLWLWLLQLQCLKVLIMFWLQLQVLVVVLNSQQLQGMLQCVVQLLVFLSWLLNML